MSQAVAVAAPADDPQPHWDLAKQLYFLAVPHEAICQKAHVSLAALRQRIHRQNWASQRDQIQHVKSLTITQTKQVSPEVAEVSEDGAVTRKALSDELKRAADSLKGLKQPKTLAEIVARGRAVDALAGPGKTVFGWSDSSSTVFDFTLHESMQVEDKGNLVATGESVIEIPQQTDGEQRLLKPESVPTEPPAAS